MRHIVCMMFTRDFVTLIQQLPKKQDKKDLYDSHITSVLCEYRHAVVSMFVGSLTAILKENSLV